MIVTAHQPHYLPWIGYFNRISCADHFVVMDNMMYTRYSYINRNRIMSSKGFLTLSIPIKHNAKLKNPINKIEIFYAKNKNWTYKHLKSIEHNYFSSPCFDKIFPWIEEAISANHKFLIDLNMDIFLRIINYLKIDTNIILASEKDIGGKKESELFLSLLEKTNSDTILIGLGASTKYIDKEKIESSGYKIACHKFNHPEYVPEKELTPKGISVVDLLMNTSQEEAIQFINTSGFYEF